MLSHLEIDIEEVLDCLGNRFGISGLDEKASRGESRNQEDR
jgi:energy-converting hydrogenase A subunit M